MKSNKEKKTRRLAAVMFTDIVGYTALMQQDEKAAAAARSLHREVFEKYHQIYHGNILQYYGDGTLSVFQSGVEAVECAIEIQKALNESDPVPLRIGLHMGDIVFDGTDVYGDGVNFASRIESMGVAGAILVSGKLNDELKNHTQIRTQSLGFFELKNIENPVEVFSVTNEGIKIPERTELKGKRKELSKTIAVLPFANMSSDEDNEYFSDGMTEEIINALAKIKELKVTSRTSSFFFKNKNIPIIEIGTALNVSTILEGSIRLAGNKMRITAQLIDVKGDFHFWSETFDRSLDDIFAVQDEVSLLIADKLREHIGHFEIEDKLIDTPEIPVETYKLYLKARYYLMKLDLPGTEKGISILKEVIETQADFALAYLGINQAYAYLGTMGMISAQEGFEKAKPYLAKALELDANLPESQVNLAWISCWQNWDLENAYRHINNALEVRPADHIYLTMANTLSLEGKFEAAFNYIDKALQLDPFAAMNHHFKGFLFYLQEKFEKAIPFFKKSLSLKPDLHFPKSNWGQSLIFMGRADEALDLFQKLPDDVPGLTKLGGTTLAYIAMGEESKVKTNLAKLEAALQTGAMGSAMNYLIYSQVMLGNHAEAIKLIEQGIEFRLPMMLLLNTEPLLKPLRSNTRFQELMGQALGKTTTFDIPQRKYKQSLFDKNLLLQYQNKLEALMAEEKPYLKPSLSLRGLAEKLDLPANHLSQLLNEGFDKNFSEFVNAYRLEAFKSKVADPAEQHLTILALAYDSGFNSKTVFNTFFKKTMGLTPKAYWKSVVG